MCGLIISGVLAQSQKQSHKMIKVDNSFDGREVTLRVGETLEVSLSENASTGYSWTIPPDLKLKLTPALREREETVDGPSGPPGKSGVRHLYFEAVAAGTAELEIHYRRSWEGEKEPTRRFRLHVLVRAAAGQ
jgi:inhibitor of cysteine peptidase